MTEFMGYGEISTANIINRIYNDVPLIIVCFGQCPHKLVVDRAYFSEFDTFSLYNVQKNVVGIASGQMLRKDLLRFLFDFAICHRRPWRRKCLSAWLRQWSLGRRELDFQAIFQSVGHDWALPEQTAG